MTKYDVTIFDDSSKLADILHYLKKCKVKGSAEKIENNCGIRGVEFLGYQIKFNTFDERIVDTLSKIWLDAYVTIHRVNLKKLSIMNLKTLLMSKSKNSMKLLKNSARFLTL